MREFFLLILIFAAPLLPGASRDVRLGDSAAAAGDYAQAALFYEKAKADPKNRGGDAYFEVREKLAGALIQSGALSDAGAVVAELETSPRAAVRTVLNAELLCARGKAKEAAGLCRPALAALKPGDPSAPRLMAALAKSLAVAGQWREAAAAYGELEKASSGEAAVDAALKKAGCLIAAGDLDAASAEHGGLLKKTAGAGDSSRAKISLLGGVIEMEKSGSAAAVQDCAKLIRALPRTPDTFVCAALCRLGKKSADRGDTEEAVRFFREADAFAETPDGRRAVMIYLAASLAAAGKKEEALLTVRTLLDNWDGGEKSDIQEIKGEAAELLFELKKYDESLALHSEIINDSGADARLKISSARQSAGILTRQKKFTEAAGMLDRMLSFAPDDKIVAGERVFLMADLLSQQGKHAEAAEAFETAAGQSAQLRGEALVRAMRSWCDAGAPAKAIALMEKTPSGELSPETAAGMSFFNSSALQRMGKTKEALAAFSALAARSPSSPFAPRALFEAGKIASEAGDNQDAAAKFDALAKNWPAHELAPFALYRKVYAKYFLGKIDEAERDALALAAAWPSSPCAVAALFWRADCHRDRMDLKEADGAYAEIIEKFGNNEDAVARAVQERASITAKLGDPDAALEMLRGLFDKYPDNKAVSEGSFLAGDILSEKGDYLRALTFYQKAAERRPGSLLETACLGRAGDCYYSLYPESGNEKMLLSAVAEYEKALAGKNITPFTRSQCLYKIGKCRELLKDDDAALAKYREVIYNYKIDTEIGENIKPHWAVKSAQAGAAILLKRKTQESARAAAALYQTLIDLKIQPSDDFRGVIDEIKKNNKL
jgi:tetratricopeptide (TPR) repeat protein